jgi:hypothetical protein
MALLPETREALARYDAWVARTLGSPDRLALAGQRVRRGIRAIGRRIRNMVLGVFGVAVLAFLYGTLVAPLGFLGVVVMVLGMYAAMMLFAGWPAERVPRAADLPNGSLATLPERVADWLGALHLPLPVRLTAEVDALAIDIRQLGRLVERITPDSARAADIERLLARHLPRLMDSYGELPPAARHSADADAHFREGLQVIRAEVGRMTAELSAERLQALETEGRFLKSRYLPGAD